MGILDARLEAGETFSVSLSFGIQHAINAALWANHVPTLVELNVVNHSQGALGDVSVHIESVPPAIRSKTWRLGEVGPGQMRALTDLDLDLDGSWLSSLTEAVRGIVVVTARA